jgi:hypothetical protein
MARAMELGTRPDNRTISRQIKKLANYDNFLKTGRVNNGSSLQEELRHHRKYKQVSYSEDRDFIRVRDLKLPVNKQTADTIKDIGTAGLELISKGKFSREIKNYVTGKERYREI